MSRNHRKKTAGLAAALAFLLVLAGCGGGQNAVNVNLTVPQRNSFSSAEEFAPQGNAEFIPMEIGGEGFSSGGGYYLFNPREEDGSNVLHFIDYASGQKTVVCSRPECTHSDESCTAWFPYGGGAMLPLPVGNKVVVVYGGNQGYYEAMGNIGIARIEVMEANGADRRRTAVFDSGSCVEIGKGWLRNGFARDEENLYFFIQHTEETDAGVTQKQQLCAYNVPSDKLFLLGEMEVTTRLIGAFEDKLVLENTPGGQSMEVDKAALESFITLFSLTDRSQAQIGSHPYLSPGRCEEETFYSISLQGRVEALNLRTGETRLITEQALTADQMTRFESVDGLWDGHLFVYSWNDREETTPSGETRILTDRVRYAIDLQTGKSWEVPFHYELKLDDMSLQMPAQIVGETQTEYLLVMDEKQTSVQVMMGKNQKMTMPYLLCSYVLIPKEDFWAGSDAKIRPVELIS